MQTSKDRILAVLKRSGSRSVDDLAAALQLAPMTVRQHLTALERDELVRVTEYRNGAGRPKHFYSLTERGDAVFPRRYDRFAALLLNELQELDAAALAQPATEDRMGLVLERLARRECAPHLARLALLGPVERAHAAAAILHEIGGFAEAVETPAGIEIRDYNCVYRGLRPEESGSCAWHGRLVPHLVGAPVEQLPPEPQSGRCCRILVPHHCADGAAPDHIQGYQHDHR
jgi:predicted ArsR family transcriptional regulator